ncbi:MAG: hypothetical protein GMKNLPBB_01793 [Myxococcota bacterium]|nr:hypothetical protein [Myxococcota bacterium]
MDDFIRLARGLFRLTAFLCLTAGFLLALTLRNRLSRSAGVSPGVNMSRLWARTATRALGVDVEAAGPLPPPGSLLAANHRSYLDIVAILIHAPASFLAKAEVSRWPILGAGARACGTLFVNRGDWRSGHSARRQAENLLAGGHSVAVFPEGTTTSGNGCAGFRRGMFLAAEAVDAPVVPVVIEYPQPSDCWVGDETFVHHFLNCLGEKRKTVRVVFGPPLHAATSHEACRASRAWILANLPNWPETPAAIPVPAFGSYAHEIQEG